MIRNYLVSIGVDKQMAEHDACAMEHVVSVDTLCAICRSSGYGKAKIEGEDYCPISLEADEK
jgi:Mn-dependent DtxR family transcriptional regulator